MELQAYLRFFWENKWWLLVGLVLGGIAGVGYVVTRSDTYQANMSLYVQRQPEPESSQYFTYEGYYAQQVAVAYTDTALKLLTNDEIVKRAAESAQLPTDPKSINNLKGAIVSKKDAPQLIKVTITMPTESQATSFSEGLAQALKERTTELNQVGDKKLAIDQVNSAPFVALVRPLLPLYAGVAAMLGLLTAMVLTALRQYINDHEVKQKR